MKEEEEGGGGGWLRLAYRPNFGISTVVLFLERALSRRRTVSRAPSPCWKEKFNRQTSSLLDENIDISRMSQYASLIVHGRTNLKLNCIGCDYSLSTTEGENAAGRSCKIHTVSANLGVEATSHQSSG